MAQLQPIMLHAHPGPNPWKITLLLEELNVPYTSKIYTTPELKQATFLAINPFGLAPVIEDPNTGLKLVESGAIIDYILSQYDADHRISFPSLPLNALMHQWLAFQNTSHGPVLQAILRFNLTEPNPSARASYVKQFHRVLSVLNDALADKQWLVGDKCSAADLSYVSFHYRIGFIMGQDAPDLQEMYPNVDAWFKRMSERETVKSVLVMQDEAVKQFAPKLVK